MNTKKFDWKTFGVAIFLITLSLISFFQWTKVSVWLFDLLKSELLTFVIWIILIVILLIHYWKNKAKESNGISEKEGLEKPIDYLQFLFTFGAIGLTLQTIAKELFAHYNFSEFSKCIGLDGFDCFGFFAVIVVLIFYSYSNLQPIILDVFEKNEETPVNEINSSRN